MIALPVHAHCTSKHGTNTVLTLRVPSAGHCLISEVAVQPGCCGYAVCHFRNTIIMQTVSASHTKAV